MKLFVLILFIFTSILADKITRTQIIMGTYITIGLKKEDKAFFQSSFEIFKEIDNNLSTYKTSSPVYILNEKKQINSTPILSEAISLSRIFYDDTQGYFDITIGSLTKDSYRFGEKPRVPNEKERKNAYTNINDIQIKHNLITISQKIKFFISNSISGILKKQTNIWRMIYRKAS